MKNIFFMLFFSMAISFIACGGGGENDENLPSTIRTGKNKVPGCSLICDIHAEIGRASCRERV